MRVNTIFILLCFIASFHVWHAQTETEALASANMLACSYDNLFINHAWWTLITAQFVHGGLVHLLGNVLFMILFGYPLEKIIGRSKFAICFLGGGVLSFLISAFIYPPDQFLVGASGAICTLIAMLMLYDPWRISFLLIGLPMPLGVAGISYVIFNFWMASHPSADAGSGSLHVAYHAHIIGFIIGIFFAAIWNPDWKKKLLVCAALFVIYYAVLLFLIRH